MQKGVVVTPVISQQYAVETEAYAQDVLYELLTKYFQKTVIKTLPETVMQTLREQANNIQKITADTGLTETQYLQCMQFLETNIEEYTDALARLEQGNSTEGDFETLKYAYTHLLSKIGSDALGEIVYSLCVYRYDYAYETCMERYEEYGYTYLKIEAETFAQDKKTLQEEVGQENFISVMQMVCLLSDLFVGRAFEEGQLASFTDHEILALLQEPSFSSVTISEAGWELLLKYLQIMVPSQSYFGKLFAKACENGDVVLLSTKMDSVLTLLSAVQKHLTVEQAALFKQNKTGQALSSIVASFGEVEWMLFDEIATLELKNEDYEAIAESFYGESYKNYSSTVKISSLDDLKNAAGTDGFLEVLKGYVAGISPAISYGVRL